MCKLYECARIVLFDHGTALDVPRLSSTLLDILHRSGDVIWKGRLHRECTSPSVCYTICRFSFILAFVSSHFDQIHQDADKNNSHFLTPQKRDYLLVAQDEGGQRESDGTKAATWR